VAEELVAETFLEDWGQRKVTTSVFVPGEDNAHELERVKESIARLRRESDAGLIVTDEDEALYLQRLKAQIDRRTALEATPARAARWIEEETDQTYQEAWDEETSEDGLAAHHRELLLEAKVKFILYHSKPSLKAALESPLANRPLEPELDTDEMNTFLGRLRTERPEVGYEEANRLYEDYRQSKNK
jgi:hypothetical protein